jgi:hypothetical protein
MYALPNDMRNGKLAEGMEENFPHHVGLRTLSEIPRGAASFDHYRPTMEINSWLNEHVGQGGYEFRKNFEFVEGEKISPFDRPYGRPTYCFKNQNDAIAFKLRWVDGV